MVAFVQGPLGDAVAAYNITAAQAALVQGYLEFVTSSYVAPLFHQEFLGPPLGAKSGGLVAARSVEDWLNGALGPLHCLSF